MKSYAKILLLISLLFLVATPILGARESRALPVHAFLDGGISLTPSGTESITLEAKMRGFATPFGPAQALATWTTGAARFAELQSGAVDELTIGNGNLVARTFWGTVTGTFSGTLRRSPSGAILFESQYTLISGTGFLSNARGSGQMSGISDPTTFAFRLLITGRVRI